MRRRTFLKGVGGVAGAVLLGGCNGNTRPGGAAGGRPTVRVVEWTGLGWPSPFTYVAGPGYWRMSLVFDTLLWPDSTGELLPWLASSHKRSEDGLTYTLDLRDITWDDGKPLTARDVAFTYEYYTSQTFTPLLVGVPRTAADVIPTGDRTVEFRLKRPDATFVDGVLGTMPIVPEHVWSKISDPMSTFDDRIFVSTGAYKMTKHDEAQGPELYEAKDGYFLGPPYVKRIEMLPAEDPLTSLRVGELDGASTKYEGTRSEVLAPFRDDPQYGIVSLDAGFAFPLYFNISRGGALADVRFRRACLHAIDRKDMVERLLTGNGQIGSEGWLPPSHLYYEPGVRTYPFDRTEAERLLDEAGYRRSGRGGPRTNPDGSPLRYVLYIPDVVPIALAELTAESLKAVGVDIDLQRIDLVRLFGTKLSASFDLILTSYPGPAGTAPIGDPDAMMRGVYHSNPPNPFIKATGYANPEVDRLLDTQLATLDVAERKRLVGQIQRIVAEDLPVAMLYYTKLYFVYRKSVFDQWYYTPGGFGTGIADVYNKHAYITGRKTGLEVRRVGED